MKQGGFLCLLLFATVSVYGQLTLSSIATEETSKKTKPRTRTESNTLTLPFWDDFSFTEGQVPLDSLWRNSQAVFIGNGIGEKPPSVGVATLDGVNAQGEGYSGNGSSSRTDSLTSCPIDLSTLSVSDDVYISFFYQFAGNGEQPDDVDSLWLEVLSVTPDTTEWIVIWPLGDQLDRSGDFTQTLVRLNDETFFHDAFQFRIQNFSRPRGFFDVWNIDYVYVNSNRSPTDDNYPDRTIGSTLSSIFDGLYAIPARHFRSNQTSIPKYEVVSLDNPGSANPYGNFLKVTFSSWLNGAETVVSFTETGNVETLFPPNRKQELQSNLFDNFQISEGQDSVFIDIKTFIDSNDLQLPPDGDYDPKFQPIDFRLNDTIQNSFVLKDYYAYDDGSAELAAGLNTSGSRIAIRYPFTPNVQDTLIAVDLYFPLSENEPAGRSVELTVWENGSVPGDVLLQEDIFLLRDSLPNKFIRYTLSTPLAVADTFFLGYSQNNEGRLGVGYDLSNDTNSEVFVNFTSVWQQNTSDEFRGSFMIRPVFGNPVPFDPINGVDEEMLEEVLVYPNPTTGVVKLKGDFETLSVYNLLGEKIMASTKIEDEQLVDLQDYPSGIYLIHISRGTAVKNFKIIKR